jgi:drug/metabolite transporter (DMT)-like permease
LIKLVDIYSGGNVSAWQTGLCRSCGMAGFSLILCKYWKIGLWDMPKNQRLNVFMRIFFGCVAQVTQFVSIYMLPFSLAIVLQFT